MSQTFQIISVFTVLLLLFFTYRLFSNGSFKEGILNGYRERLKAFFQEGDFTGNMEAGFHYILVHLLVPVIGFSFFLRSDGNFLVFIASAVWSIQLIQRLFPGMHEE